MVSESASLLRNEICVARHARRVRSSRDMSRNPNFGQDKEGLNPESRLTVVFACTLYVGLIVGVGRIFGGETDRESAGAQGCEDDGVEMHGDCGNADLYDVSNRDL